MGVRPQTFGCLLKPGAGIPLAGRRPGCLPEGTFIIAPAASSAVVPTRSFKRLLERSVDAPCAEPPPGRPGLAARSPSPLSVL